MRKLMVAALLLMVMLVGGGQTRKQVESLCSEVKNEQEDNTKGTEEGKELKEEQKKEDLTYENQYNAYTVQLSAKKIGS